MTATTQTEGRSEAPFAIAPSAYLPHVASRLAWKLWWLALLPAAAVVYGLAADWRWILVGLILLMVVYPMVMSVAVVRYAASERILRRAATASVAEADDMLILLAADGSEIERVRRPEYITTSRGHRILPLGPEPDNILLLPG